MVRRRRIFGNFLHPAFPASHMQHIYDLHSKFALGPHHVWKYIQSAVAKIWRGIKADEEERNHRAKYNGLPYSIGWP